MLKIKDKLIKLTMKSKSRKYWFNQCMIARRNYMEAQQKIDKALKMIDEYPYGVPDGFDLWGLEAVLKGDSDE